MANTSGFSFIAHFFDRITGYFLDLQDDDFFVIIKRRIQKIE